MGKGPLTKSGVRRSAGLQPAVSQYFQPADDRSIRRNGHGNVLLIGNRRYGRLQTCATTLSMALAMGECPLKKLVANGWRFLINCANAPVFGARADRFCPHKCIIRQEN